MAQMVKSLPAMQETWVHSLDREDLWEKDMATPLYSWSCTTIITIWDSAPQKEALNPLTVTLHPPPSPSGQHSCFQSLQIFLFCIFHIHNVPSLSPAKSPNHSLQSCPFKSTPNPLLSLGGHPKPSSQPPPNIAYCPSPSSPPTPYQ